MKLSALLSSSALLGALVVPLAQAAPAEAEAVAAEAPRADAFRSKLEKWVETRRILSEERSEWELERETLKATRDLLAQEKKALQEQIAELESSTADADGERRRLLLERGEHQRALPELEARVRTMESEVQALAARLPDPLRKKIEILLSQIPDDPTRTRLPLGQRLMNLLGVLAQAEKWNGTATFVGETRPVGDQKVQVRTLYWGLGRAIYVDAQGRTAGIGQPTAEGWQFSNDAALAGAAGHLLDIYEGNVDAIDFVSIPIAVE